ncbi:SPASM domain-containing protein [Kaistella haifensis]|nr:SPASM domain-containing protein [Kaistella haifensis]
MNYKLSRYVYVTNSSIGNEEEQKLIYSTKSGDVMIINESTLKKLQENNIKELGEEILDKLIFSEIVVPEEENEFKTLIDEFNLSKLDNDSLGLVITPTANCQLGCSYCGQSHSKINIDKELSNKIISHISNKLKLKKYSNIDLTWYGAEPLMGINAIRELSKKLIDICKFEGVIYNASMITNGLNLNLKNFEELVSDLNVRSFQITIDGIKETHDNSRYTKKGKPTFDVITKNLINAINSKSFFIYKPNFIIRVNVHKENFRDVENLLEYFKKVGIHDKITMSFAPVHDWGNNKADEQGLTIQEYSELEIEWNMKMQELGYNKVNLIPNRIYGTCMTTTDDAELIDANGKISYCWEVPYTSDFESDSGFFIGDLTKAYYQGDISKQKDYPLRDWYNDIENGNNNSSNCKNCIYLPVCGGQCPISWYKGVRACPSFKFNMEERLILNYIEQNG